MDIWTWQWIQVQLRFGYTQLPIPFCQMHWKMHFSWRMHTKIVTWGQWKMSNGSALAFNFMEALMSRYLRLVSFLEVTTKCVQLYIQLNTNGSHFYCAYELRWITMLDMIWPRSRFHSFQQIAAAHRFPKLLQSFDFLTVCCLYMCSPIPFIPI